MPRPELASLQRGLLQDLAAPAAPEPARLARLFAPPPRGRLEERWRIYGAGYVERVAEALENDYPALARILGPGPLRSLATRYVRACPPRSPDLGRAGDRLAAFLESDPLAAELPFLPDLARFEWAVAEAFVAEDGEPLGWAELAALGAEAVAAARLELQPGSALLRSAWPLVELWACREQDDEQVSVELEGRPVTALVYRHGLEVRARALDADEAALVEAADRGQCLEDVRQACGQDEAALARLVQAFRRMVHEGTFAKLR